MSPVEAVLVGVYGIGVIVWFFGNLREAILNSSKPNAFICLLAPIWPVVIASVLVVLVFDVVAAKSER